MFEAECNQSDLELIEDSWSKHLHTSSNKCPKEHQFFGPLTELAVDIANSASDRGLGKIDMYRASELIRKRRLRSVSVLTGLLYTHRFLSLRPAPLLASEITSADLFLVSMMLASKYLYDEGTDDEVFNDEWAADFDTDVKELNQLEAAFLTALNWNLFVSREEFRDFIDRTDGELASRLLRNSRRDAWKELMLLLNQDDVLQDISENLNYFVKTLVTFSAAYFSLVASVTLPLLALSPLYYSPSNFSLLDPSSCRLLQSPSPYTPLQLPINVQHPCRITPLEDSTNPHLPPYIDYQNLSNKVTNLQADDAFLAFDWLTINDTVLATRGGANRIKLPCRSYDWSNSPNDGLNTVCVLVF